MNKKILDTPFLVVGITICMPLIILLVLLRLSSSAILIVINMFDRIEWWIHDEHKSIEQPLNPFNTKFKDIIYEEFYG